MDHSSRLFVKAQANKRPRRGRSRVEQGQRSSAFPEKNLRTNLNCRSLNALVLQTMD